MEPEMTQAVVPGTEGHVAAVQAGAAAPKPKRPRQPSKKTRAALDAEFQRGYREAMDRDRGPSGLGIAIVMIVCLVGGFLVGHISRGLWGG